MAKRRKSNDRGMRCPVCGGHCRVIRVLREDTVVDGWRTRSITRRRQVCQVCESRWWTIEQFTDTATCSVT